MPADAVINLLLPAPVRIGIGVITYNRRERLLATLAALQARTSTPAIFVVADDGSRDGTADAVRHAHPLVRVVGGENRGVCWNRNRALWALHVEHRCDVVILVEDDAAPTEDGWELDWILAARRHGHINLDGAWFRDGVVSGSGTPADPTVSQGVSGQVSAFSSKALHHVGFFDTRFQGYGMGHVEHSFRMIRAGYGGQVVSGKAGDFDTWQLGNSTAFQMAWRGLPEVRFFLLRSPVRVHDEGSHRDPCPVRIAANQVRFAELVHDQVYRAPWSCDGEMERFRAEFEETRQRRAAAWQGA